MNLSGFVLAFFLSAARTAPAEGQRAEDCSGQGNNFLAPDDNGMCVENWSTDGYTTKEKEDGIFRKYPDDFEGLENEVEIYRCPASNKRVIISNAIPDHSVLQHNVAGLCERPYAIEMPFDPVYDRMMDISEVPIRGIIAMALNGVPAYGPQESDGLNAVEITTSDKIGANFWYGHAGGNSWHVHNPRMGMPRVDTLSLLGYAMDGFEIYGPLTDADADQLDDCNGWFNPVDGTYRYHIKSLEQVDDDADYCRSGYDNTANDPLINWDYILGCYKGDISNTFVYDSANYTLPDDCFVERNPTVVGPGGNGEINVIGSDEDADLENDDVTEPEPPEPIDCPAYEPWDGTTRPNIIVMQPDDLVFLDAWAPPPNTPTKTNQRNPIPGAGMPHIEELRQCGLQMMQAYTASPVCGTSRFSTITGKMPSRAASVRSKFDQQPSSVTIPNTKLNGKDCNEKNLAHAFRNEDYATAMIGKWHLSKIDEETYSYQNSAETVQQCGFDFVDGLYAENFIKEGDEPSNFHPGNFSHNMEWITYEAIKFINETTTGPDAKPFFMYFNPTVPHGNQDVLTALEDYPCTNTSNGVLEEEPWIRYMSEDDGCEAYRETVKQRAAGEILDLGKIWVDDSVGALVHALKTQGVWENTIFLFQEDHGMDAKGSLHEGGIRIPQFIHYPARIPAGTTLDAPVSTIDIAATMLDYAGIEAPYKMDGESWMDVVGNYERTQFWKNNRCLFFEVFKDRAVRCGCYKYMDIDSQLGDTWSRGDQNDMANELGGMLFDLCEGTDDYITADDNNREGENETIVDDFVEGELVLSLDCHLTNTDPALDPGWEACGPVEPDEYSATPSEQPSDASSDSPTDAPSDSPSTGPSEQPSDAPSDSPTDAPSDSPSTGPSEQPSDSPSTGTSDSPSIRSSQPSTGTSDAPSSIAEPPCADLTTRIRIVNPRTGVVNSASCIQISSYIDSQPDSFGPFVCQASLQNGSPVSDACPVTCAPFGFGPCVTNGADAFREITVNAPTDAPSDSSSIGSTEQPSTGTSDAPSGIAEPPCADFAARFRIVNPRTGEVNNVSCSQMSSAIDIFGPLVCEVSLLNGSLVSDACPATCAPFGFGPCVTN